VVTLEVGLTDDEAIVNVTVQQPRRVGVQRQVVFHRGMAHGRGRHGALESAARQRRASRLRLGVIDQQIEIRDA